jgi:hypothetical protein
LGHRGGRRFLAWSVEPDSDDEPDRPRSWRQTLGIGAGILAAAALIAGSADLLIRPSTETRPAPSSGIALPNFWRRHPLQMPQAVLPTNRRPATLPPVLTDERLSFAVNQFRD